MPVIPEEAAARVFLAFVIAIMSYAVGATPTAAGLYLFTAVQVSSSDTYYVAAIFFIVGATMVRRLRKAGE